MGLLKLQLRMATTYSARNLPGCQHGKTDWPAGNGVTSSIYQKDIPLLIAGRYGIGVSNSNPSLATETSPVVGDTWISSRDPGAGRGGWRCGGQEVDAEVTDRRRMRLWLRRATMTANNAVSIQHATSIVWRMAQPGPRQARWTGVLTAMWSARIIPGCVLENRTRLVAYRRSRQTVDGL